MGVYCLPRSYFSTIRFARSTERLDRLTHHIHILEMNGESYRLKHSRENTASQVSDDRKEE